MPSYRMMLQQLAAPVSSGLRAQHPDVTDRRAPHRMLGARGRLVVVFVAYGLLALVVWWHVWSSHPSSTAICGCGDPSLFLWSIEWPAHAILHGLNPLYSSAMLYPRGFNLLDNTSVLGVGIPLAPVTWLWGPVATINVASTLAPAVSAMAMFWLLRRWMSWTPAAFVGGLLYGFSPFMVASLQNSYLTLSLLPVPPLVVACLDEIMVRQRRRAATAGVILAVLVTIEFFLSTEVLAMMVVVAAVGTVVIVEWAAVTARDELRAHLPHALRGMLVAAVSAGILLAYPLWFALAGPAHLSGRIPATGYQALHTNSLHMFVRDAAPVPKNWTALARVFGWYHGSAAALVDPAYLGIGLLLVVVCGWALWWRDPRLGFFGLLGCVTAWCSLGASSSHWSLWAPFAKLPELENVLPGRFSIFVDLCAAIMLACVVEHVARAVEDRVRPDLVQAVGRVAGRTRRPWASGLRVVGTTARFAVRGGTVRRLRTRLGPQLTRRLGRSAAALAVTAVAVVPLAAADARVLPLGAVHVAAPRWFTTNATGLAGHQVLFVYPFVPSGIQSPMVWQALAGERFDMVGGGGPGGFLARAGKEKRGAEVLMSLSGGLRPLPIADPANLAAVRSAFRGWGVTMVVVPDQWSLPVTERGRNPAYALGFLSSALGRPPQRQRGAWLWTGVRKLVR